jgi:hypothetical protein
MLRAVSVVTGVAAHLRLRGGRGGAAIANCDANHHHKGYVKNVKHNHNPRLAPRSSSLQQPRRARNTVTASPRRCSITAAAEAEFTGTGTGMTGTGTGTGTAGMTTLGASAVRSDGDWISLGTSAKVGGCTS